MFGKRIPITDCNVQFYELYFFIAVVNHGVNFVTGNIVVRIFLIASPAFPTQSSLTSVIMMEG